MEAASFQFLLSERFVNLKGWAVLCQAGRLFPVGGDEGFRLSPLIEGFARFPSGQDDVDTPLRRAQDLQVNEAGHQINRTVALCKSLLEVCLSPFSYRDTIHYDNHAYPPFTLSK
jgi:hypothetical protein